MAKLYTISGVRLSGIANQVRRIAEISDRLSPAGIEETLAGIEPGGGPSYMLRHIISQGDDVKSLTAPKCLEPASMYYYSDIVLPKLPQNILADRPYCFIRNAKNDQVYSLFMSSAPWIHMTEKETGNNYAVLMTDGWQEEVYRYDISYADAGNVPTWTLYTTYNTDVTYNVNTRPLIWTNQNITTVDDEDAGAVKYYWSMPVPAGEG